MTKTIPDEKPVPFFADFRKGLRSKKDGVQYETCRYIPNGTASIFLFTEPLPDGDMPIPKGEGLLRIGQSK